ncbi:hypothetical protein JCM5353_007721 [Sporobolomyces roseus]
MTTVDNANVKIDRLSSLPPELLLLIFDLAYDYDQLLLNPLSKRLLPYVRRNLYRQIRLTSLSSLIKLLRTAWVNPSLGKLVQNLDTNEVSSTTILNDLEMTVNAFPRLVSFRTGYIDSIEPFPSSSLSTLRALSYKHSIIKSQDLVTISRLINLSQLEVTFDHRNFYNFRRYVPRDTRLANLDTLSLRSVSVSSWDSDKWLPDLLHHCPVLTRLELSDTLYPYFIGALPRIAPLLPLLTSLKLEVTEILDDYYHITCDQHLTLFPNLRHLDLSDNTIGRSLTTFLRQLPNLSSLRLGPQAYIDGPSASDLLSLVASPTKPANFNRLILDCVNGKIGERWDVDKLEEEIDSVEFDKIRGWKQPEFSERFGIPNIQHLVLAGQGNGVEIAGTTIEAVAIREAHRLERANRKVMKAFKCKSLGGLVQLRRQEYHRCPDLDFDKLDPNNLKLVKIELPEENWFALTLE